MLLAVTLFSGLNASVKFLTTDYPTTQILWARYTGHIIYVFILLAPRRALGAVKSNRPRIQLSRSVLMVGATVCYYTALRYVALPTAAAVNFTSPLMVALLAIPILGEHVGLRRWAAILMGFGGALVIARPGFDVIHPAVLLVFGTAFCYGLYQVLTRKVAPTILLRRASFTQHSSVSSSPALSCPLTTSCRKTGWIFWSSSRRVSSAAWVTSAWSKPMRMVPHPRSRRSITLSLWARYPSVSSSSVSFPTSGAGWAAASSLRAAYTLCIGKASLRERNPGRPVILKGNGHNG